MITIVCLCPEKSRSSATSKVELILTIVKSWKLLQLTNCHKELHLRCYNSPRSTSYSWLFYIAYIYFYNVYILNRLNPKTKYVGLYIKYIYNKNAVKNATVGNITLHMYFMYKPCKNFIP